MPFGLGLAPALTAHRLAVLIGQPQLQTVTPTSDRKRGDTAANKGRPHAPQPRHGPWYAIPPTMRLEEPGGEAAVPVGITGRG